MTAISYSNGIYWSLRICVLALGLILGLVFGYSLIRNASFYFSAGGIPPLRWQSIPSDALLLFYSLVLLLPHRWFMKKPLFLGKILIYLIFVLFAVYRCFRVVIDFVTGKTVFINDGDYPAVTEFDVIFVFIVFVLSFLAPLTLFLKYRLQRAPAML